MNYEEIETLLNNSRWVFAKSMPKTPHEYTLRKEWDSEVFERVVQHIRDNGKQEEFRIFSTIKIYTYLYVGDYKYWTMGAPLNETILINKAKV